MAELKKAQLVEKTSRLWLKKSKEHLVEVLGEESKVIERISTAFSQVEKTLKVEVQGEFSFPKVF